MAKEATERKKSPVNEKMLEAEGSTAITGAAPGQMEYGDIHLEDLGRLSDFPDSASIDDPEEGTGEWCVVLVDFMSGAGEHDAFTKGDVRRISRIVPGYANPEVDRNLVRSRVKRLLQIQAIRLASREEAGKGRIEVSFESESASVQAERQRRMAVEQENEILRERLGLARDAQIMATPGQAGASEAAQEAVAADPSWDEDDDKES